MKIHDMNISARAKSCLLRVGYRDSNEIEGLSDDDLLAIKNLNRNCVDEIRKALNGDNDDKELLIEESSSISTMDISIDVLELSNRCYNCLKRTGIDTLGDLCNMTIIDLMKIRSMGRKSCAEIRDKLKEFGLTLREQDNTLPLDEYPKSINVTSSISSNERGNGIQIMIEEAYWKSNGILYVPYLKVCVSNISTNNISSLKMNVYFYDNNAKELWGDAYDMIMSGDVLEPGFNKIFFLSANVGYSRKRSEITLPSISAQIFVNSIYYGTVHVDKSYSPKSELLPIEERRITKYSFYKKGKFSEIKVKRIP